MEPCWPPKRPEAIRTARRLGAVGLLVGTALIVVAPVGNGQRQMMAVEAPSSATEPTDVVSMLVSLTNIERARVGVAPLRENERLARAAQFHADQMSDARRLAHALAGARFPRAVDRLSAVGYRWRAYAENLGSGQSTAEAAMAAWLGSPQHLANLLNEKYTEVGVGFSVDAAGRPYYVQLFARPR